MWRNPPKRREPPRPSWTERELALENAPWSPLSDLDDYDAGHTGPSRYYDPEPYRSGWRRWLPERARGRGKLWWGSRIAALILFLFIVLVAWLAITAPLSKSLEPIAPPQITLLAADGTPIARNGAVVEEPVEVADLPEHVIQPFLAIEDRRFYDHWGIDPRGVGRALVMGVGGGSTITQQLAKFTFLTPEQTLTRKAREALIALWLEAWLTKDEILERYLSNAYFGDNMYGLRAASLHYFYRQPENLRPEQAAMLAGLLQAPSRLAPTRNPDLAAQRYALVKGAMVDAGYISQADADAMGWPELDVRTRNDLPTGTYFADWALPAARSQSEMNYARQTLTTTLDSRLQAAANRAIDRATLGGAQVALVAMRPNGEVVAMVGGKDYSESPFNRATQARRQPGSTFKLFVYLAALRNGWDPDDTISNAAFEEGSYRPSNANDRYSQSITLREAFAQSSNVAAVRLLNEVGSKAVIETARDLGVTSPLPEGDPSMALGTSTMSLLELTAAYAGVAANNFPVEPHAFARGEDGWLDWLWDGQGSLSSSDHGDMEALLRSAINSGTGRAAMLSAPNYGKTGTTQDNRDALFVGYAGEGANRLVVGVWIGNDDNSPLSGISGGGLPAQIWRDFMRQALGAAAAPPRPTPSPDPSGPVQPLDVPELQDIPLGDGQRLIIGEDEALFSTEVEGVPLELRVRDGELSFELDETELERRVQEELQPEP
ncbi:transglycosylase domain-containing protein [Aurantiacibacter poecillastricola]|uniref:transglycosylase domain-containing protein n=1 Tax=Aurantiacibacter poecillastricola TaxID=3064385 RepID=UPI00273DF5F1|nr:transglycosylase domain-containing protein [Aurantiacibacter sp. 219JJ12-13]MDP5262525.1 transglycosylase domain-containing protein [Aurantiacibacter sp. 219JJ12-13]